MLKTIKHERQSSIEDTSARQSSSKPRNRKRQRPVKKEFEASDIDVSDLGLCSRCRTINFDATLASTLQIPEHGIQIMSLGKPNAKTFDPRCRLCNLLLSVATNYKRHYELELRLFDRIPKVNDESMPCFPRVEDRFLAVVRRNDRLVFDARIAHEIGSNGVLVHSTDTKESLTQVSIVNPERVDYEKLRKWLTICIEEHTETCNSDFADKTIEHLQVIDCLDNEVKDLPKAEEYAALSYVWGQSPVSTRFDTSEAGEEAQELISDVPLTIRDAIQLVKELGRRYLWIDRYCIPHTDRSKRVEAILNMNEIYAGATFTIVALYGGTSEAGLPGVSSVHRTGVQKVAIHNGDAISTLSPLTSIIKTSTWATRGWTFQEARLSRRCLFLSHQQAYFSCHRGTCSESMPAFSASFPAARHLHPRGLEPSMFASDSNLIFSGVFLDRLSYSQRTLTYQNDALDAFRGILRIHPYTTFWGITVNHNGWNLDPTTCFVMSLLWARGSLATFDAHLSNTRTAIYTRRPGFPTWSWLGVIGEVFQFGTYEACTYRKFFRNEIDEEPEQLTPAITVRLESSGVDLREAVRLSQTNMLPELSPSLLIEGDLVRVKRERNASVKQGKVGHIRYRFCDKDDQVTTAVYILPRIDLDEDDRDTTEAQDALVLIDWRDGGKVNQRRFILMLLRWVEEGVAERVGLLGRYYEKWNAVFLANLWRRRVNLELR